MNANDMIMLILVPTYRYRLEKDANPAMKIKNKFLNLKASMNEAKTIV